MKNVNKAILIGNVVKTPEVKEISGGQKMVTLTIATNRSWSDGSGQKQHQAEFHNLVAWGKVADICARFLQKGTLVYVEGYLKTRSWEVESGNRLFKTEVVIQDVLVLDRGVRNADEGHKKPVPQKSAAQADDSSDDLFADDDLFVDGEKSATEIEQTLSEKLAAGNDVVADTSIGDNNDTDLNIDEPLFAEEKN